MAFMALGEGAAAFMAFMALGDGAAAFIAFGIVVTGGTAKSACKMFDLTRFESKLLRACHVVSCHVMSWASKLNRTQHCVHLFCKAKTKLSKLAKQTETGRTIKLNVSCATRHSPHYPDQK